MLYTLCDNDKDISRILEVREKFFTGKINEMSAIHQIAGVLGIKVMGNILMLEDVLRGD